MIVKICGVTRVEDAASIAAAGADYIGLNFWPQSKRFVTIDRALELAAAIRAHGATKIAGVFVDAPPVEIAEIAERVGLDVIQLHGDESRADLGHVTRDGRRVWRAIAARPGMTIDPAAAEALLLDTPSTQRGGTGATFDWSIATELRRAHPTVRIVLAGGLTPDNVAEAIAAVQPWGVDVASGVESSPGIKDLARVAAFVAAARVG